MNDHDGCIILNMLNGIGGSRANALIEFCGSVSAIFDSDAGSLSRIRGISEGLADRILNWRDNVDFDRELEIARNGGVTILCRTDDEYPAALGTSKVAVTVQDVKGKSASAAKAGKADLKQFPLMMHMDSILNAGSPVKLDWEAFGEF